MRVRRVGIDAGGSLLKMAIEEAGQYHYKKYPVTQMEEAIGWLSFMAQGASVGLTGGRAHVLQNKFFPSARIIPEFEATCEGARFLLHKKNNKVDQPFLLVNIGTGTSWYLVDGKDDQRILGSGIGGGTFMGLGQILAGANDFQKLVELAKAGEKEKVDLLVKDIYPPEISPLDGNLTAGNFAKAAISSNRKGADMAASALNLVAETIILLTKQTAQLHGVKNIIYIGSTLAGNAPLQDGLVELSKMAGLQPDFLEKGEYCGALGAIM